MDDKDKLQDTVNIASGIAQLSGIVVLVCVGIFLCLCLLVFI